MNKIDIKMHSLILLLGEDNLKQQWKDVFQKELNKIDATLVVHNAIDSITDNSVWLNNHFILLDSNMKMEDIAILREEVKEEQFNFKIINFSDKNLFFKKNPLTKFVTNINKSVETNLEFIDYKLWKSCHFESEKDVFFIGDIHENVSALKEMIKIVPENAQIVLLGDYLDKGGQTEDIILEVESLVNNGAKILSANHESYVVRRLKNEIKKIEVEEEIFSSLKTLYGNKELTNKVINLYENSLPFFSYDSEKVKVYATHAPCEKKYLGRLSSDAAKAQRNFYFKSRDVEGMRTELEFLKEHDESYFHIFGHVAHKMETIEHSNKFWLDTGAVYGNKLTGLLVKKSGEKTLYHVDSEKLNDTELFFLEQSNKKKLKP